MKADIRLATLDEYTAIASFIGQHWKKDHAYTRSKELFDWTFRDNPAWHEPGYSISVAMAGGDMIGMLGVIPFKLNDHGSALKTCWLVNWLVIPEARKDGNGLALLHLFAKDLGYNTISFGINDTIARLYRALKWQDMPLIPRLEWINPSKRGAAECLLAMTNPAATEDQLQMYISKVSAPAIPHDLPEAYPIHSITASAWDRDGWNVWSRKTIGCARDYAYLNWRYLQHPSYKYETRVIAEGKQLGLIVWRIETTRKANSEGQLESYVPFVRIVEFLPASEVNARELMARCLVEAAAADALAVDFYCYNAELIGILQRIGFSICAGTSDVFLPNHTQPIARGSSIRSAIKISSREEISAQNPEWYWTRSDSDQDRPN